MKLICLTTLILSALLVEANVIQWTDPNTGLTSFSSYPPYLAPNPGWEYPGYGGYGYGSPVLVGSYGFDRRQDFNSVYGGGWRYPYYGRGGRSSVGTENTAYDVLVPNSITSGSVSQPSVVSYPGQVPSSTSTELGFVSSAPVQSSYASVSSGAPHVTSPQRVMMVPVMPHIGRSQPQHTVQEQLSHVQQPTIVSIHEPKSIESMQSQQTLYSQGNRPVSHFVSTQNNGQQPIVLPLGPSSAGSPYMFSAPVRPGFSSVAPGPITTPFLQIFQPSTVGQSGHRHQESTGHHQVSQLISFVPGQVGVGGGYTSSSFYEGVPSVPTTGSFVAHSVQQQQQPTSNELSVKSSNVNKAAYTDKNNEESVAVVNTADGSPSSIKNAKMVEQKTGRQQQMY